MTTETKSSPTNDALNQDLAEGMLTAQVNVAITEILAAQTQVRAWEQRVAELKATTRPLLDALDPSPGTLTFEAGRARRKSFDTTSASPTLLLEEIGALVAAKKITGAVAMALQRAISVSHVDSLEIMPPLEEAAS